METPQNKFIDNVYEKAGEIGNFNTFCLSALPWQFSYPEAYPIAFKEMIKFFMNVLTLNICWNIETASCAGAGNYPNSILQVSGFAEEVLDSVLFFENLTAFSNFKCDFWAEFLVGLLSSFKSHLVELFILFK